MPDRDHSNRAGGVPDLATLAAALVTCVSPAVFSSCSNSADGSAEVERPNVLFVLVDTLRWDHLSAYGYERQTSPRIDALGRDGWVFEHHVSHAGQTVPATVSMLISQYPVEHGFVHEGNGHFAENPPYFPGELVFLAEVLREAGYRTGGFVANPFLRREHNFNQGFEHYIYSSARGSTLTRAARAWIEGEEDERPYFTYLHLMDVHSPYTPPREYHDRYPAPEGGHHIYHNGCAPNATPADVACSESLYDAQINYVDDLLAELFEGLEASGHMENTLVVFTADHGDEFLEHGGLGHGTSVYSELVHAPLILCWPERLDPGRRVEHITQHIDLAPTLLDLLEIERPPSFRGHTIFDPPGPVYAENGPWRAVYADGAKLIVNLERDSKALFAVDDPLDLKQVEDEALERRLMMHLAVYLDLETVRRERLEQSGMAWTGSELTQLQALGYSGSDSAPR